MWQHEPSHRRPRKRTETGSIERAVKRELCHVVEALMHALGDHRPHALHRHRLAEDWPVWLGHGSIDDSLRHVRL